VPQPEGPFIVEGAGFGLGSLADGDGLGRRWWVSGGVFTALPGWSTSVSARRLGRTRVVLSNAWRASGAAGIRWG
jgi:hypothetical protein